MSAPLPLRFVLSAPDVDSLPETPAEVALIGRSNVGKSSLLNALANRKALAEVSNTPGRTRLLNLFELPDRKGTVVDLPGYGYAKVSKEQRALLARRVEGYLERREGLEMVMVLVDGEIGPTKLDVEVLDEMRHALVPHSIIATKHDKVKSSARQKRKRELAAKCMLEPDDVIWVSAHTGVGIERLRGIVMGWLAHP